MRIPNIPLQNIMSMHNVMGLEMQMSNRNQRIIMTSSNGNKFPRYWPFVRGTHRSPVNSPHKGLWRGALMFSLIGDRINGWVNNREAGDLKRHRVHYDVIVMMPMDSTLQTTMMMQCTREFMVTEMSCQHSIQQISNGSWCMGIKGEMYGTVCVTFTWDMYIYIYELFIAFVSFVVCSLL